MKFIWVALDCSGDVRRIPRVQKPVPPATRPSPFVRAAGLLGKPNEASAWNRSIATPSGRLVPHSRRDGCEMAYQTLRDVESYGGRSNNG